MIQIRQKLLAFLLCCMCIATPVLAFDNGNELHTAMQRSNTPSLDTLRFIKGVLNGANWGYQMGKDGTVMERSEADTQRGLGYCLYGGVTLGQAHDVIAKFLVDHPERRNMDAAFLVLIAMRNAFSCNK